MALNFFSKKYHALKAFIYRLDEGFCHICHERVSYQSSVLDHIIPTAVSGRDKSINSDEYWNLRIAHKCCNTKRSNGKIAGQIRLPLPCP